MRSSKAAIIGGEQVRTAPFPERKTMGAAEKAAVLEVMDSDVLSAFVGGAGAYFGGGEKVREFEARWADSYGFQHAVSVNSWTSGLIAAIGACGVGPGDEVICSPYTMSASATCAMFYGGIPVFADVQPHSWNLDPKSIEARITPRTKAIVVVHIFGYPADMDEILAIAKRHNLRVIEDAAQAPGATYKGEPVGAIGDLGGFSLNFHKHIHTGEGGMIVTNDDDLALRCRLIRNHGENSAEPFGLEDWTNVIGQNYRLTELQAAIGLCQLDRLPGYLERRRELAAHLHLRIAGIDGLSSDPVTEDRTHAHYVFGMRYDADSVGLSRSLFRRAVAAELPAPHNVEATPLTEGYIKPLYFSRVYQERIGLKGHFPWSMNPDVEYDYAAGLCPVAERMYEHELLLTFLVREPCTKSDVDDFADALEKVVANADAIRAAMGDDEPEAILTPVDAASQNAP